MGKIFSECRECELEYNKLNDLKVKKVVEGYIKLNCPNCNTQIDELSYPID